LEASATLQARQPTSLLSHLFLSNSQHQDFSLEPVTAAPLRHMCLRIRQTQVVPFIGVGTVYPLRQAGGRRFMQRHGHTHEPSFRLLYNSLLRRQLSRSRLRLSRPSSTVLLPQSFLEARQRSLFEMKGLLRPPMYQPQRQVPTGRSRHFSPRQRRLPWVLVESSRPLLAQ
jgi:hypothetical protein